MSTPPSPRRENGAFNSIDFPNALSHPGSMMSERPTESIEPTTEDLERESNQPSNPADMNGPLAVSNGLTSHADVAVDEIEKPTTIHSDMSNDSSAEAAVPVSRSDRRGLFWQLCFVREVDRPTRYRRSIKWFLTFIVSVSAATGPMASSIVLPALQPISKDFHAAHATTNLSVSLYLLALGIFPLWWSSLSETYGRRSIYLISFALFAVFTACAATANNVAVFIAMRVMSGGAAASVQAVGAGSIADLWEVKERGRAMGTFYLGPLMGPFLSPIIGGVLALKLGWRSTMWFLTIMGGCITLFILFCLPETLPRETQEATKARLFSSSTAEKDSQQLKKVSSRQSVKNATKRWAQFFQQVIIDPLSICLLIRYPPILLTVWLTSVTFGSLYFLSVAIQTSFSSDPYNYDELIVGLMYIPSSIGYISASLLGGPWIDRIMHREARKVNRYDANGKLIFQPEDRMRENAWLAGACLSGGLIWWGWSIGAGAFWVVPSLANVMFGFGSMLVFGMASTMLTEFLPRRPSAGIAVNNFVRNFFSFAGSFVAEPLIRKYTHGGALGHGNGWIFTVLGAIALMSSWGVVLALPRYSGRWREKMKELR